MSWSDNARVIVAKWGTPARFAVRHLVGAAFPGGAAVAELIDKLLECVHQTAKDQVEVDAHARRLASDEELRRAGEVLAEVNGRLARLTEQVVHLEGLPDAADRLIRGALAGDEEVRAGFAQLAGLIGRFDRIEEQGREILRRVGYGNDQLEAILALMLRQSVVVEFVEELRGAGVQPRQLGEMLAALQSCLGAARAGRVAQALPEARALEAARPESAAVQLTLAVGASLAHDLPSAERALTKATRLRPADARLAELGRRVSRANPVSESPRPPTIGQAARPVEVGDVLDGWTLTRRIGHGGGGQVFQAERDGHKRAMKLLHPEMGLNRDFEESFNREILTLHGLGGQPFLVKFDTFGTGRLHGHPYFLMELIEGESLQTRIERLGVLAAAEAVPLIRRASGEGGMATVHARGIVHRDIKPANLMLRPDGTPVFVDFGLALSGPRGLSSIGRMSGYTIMFAAPEQLRGKPADARSDVYALAGTLLYALTRTEPDDFDPSRLPAALEPLREVFTKSLDPRRDLRPAHAGAFAELLDRIPPGSLPNQPLGTDDGGKSPAPIVIVKRKNVLMPDLPPGLKPFGGQVQARATLAGHVGTVHSVAFSPDGRTLATASADNTARLWGAADSKHLATLTGHGRAVYSVAFSPDGRTLATASADYKARLWGAADGKHLATLTGHGDSVRSVAFSPDGLTLATASDDKTARLWGAADGKHLATLTGHENTVLSVAFSPDGRTLATASADKTARLWGAADGRHLATLTGHSDFVRSVAFSPDGRTLATASDDKTARLWGAADGKHLATLTGHKGYVYSVAFSPDGRTLATASQDNIARLWGAADGKHLATLTGHGETVYSVAFSPDGRTLATTSADNTARLWLLLSEGETFDPTESRPALPPRATTTLLRSGDGLVYPGDFLWAQLTVANDGKGEMVRMLAEVRSESPVLDGLRAALGRIGPGEKVERCLATIVPAETPPGEILGELTFHEANGHAPAARPLAFTVAPLPRPDFPVSWRFVNDGSGSSHGKGDGRPRRGEFVDVVVKAENRTGEDFAWLFLSLRAVAVPDGVRVTGPRHDLGPLADGAAAEGRVGFRIEAGCKPGPIRLELRVEGGDGRTFAVVPIETNLG